MLIGGKEESSHVMGVFLENSRPSVSGGLIE